MRTSTCFKAASHYAHHWFNPWNENGLPGFSQTTYPPLTHQWIALLSNVVGLKMGYMLVQLIGVLLLPVGVYRFARIWVEDRAASYAAPLGTVVPGGHWHFSYTRPMTVGHSFLRRTLPECTSIFL